jgi:hypothetical protein
MSAPFDIVDPAVADYPGVAKGLKDESTLEKQVPYTSASEELIGPNGEQYPTEEEYSTLRRVYGKVNWMIYIIGVVEMCERFAYYGTTAVCTYTRLTYEEDFANQHSRQLHSARPSYHWSLSRSRCCRLRSGWCFGHGTTSFHRIGPVQLVLLVHHAHGW